MQGRIRFTCGGDGCVGVHRCFSLRGYSILSAFSWELCQRSCKTTNKTIVSSQLIRSHDHPGCVVIGAGEFFKNKLACTNTLIELKNLKA